MLNKSDMQAFEDFMNTEQTNVIGIGFKPSDLKGIGTEYLVIDGMVAAKFYNGQMIVAVMKGNDEPTMGMG